MKLLLIFSILILSAPAFSQQSLSGTTWALSGVGCRESSLAADTHISKLPTSGDVTAGVIHFVDGSNINMTATVQGTETSNSGTYSVNGNEVTVTGGGSEEGSMTINIVGERLVIVGSRTESVKECCNAKFVEQWKGYKEEVENWPANHGGNTHSLGTWEEQKAKNGWDEQWMAENEIEWNTLRDKCRNEKPFVYVLGTVD